MNGQALFEGPRSHLFCRTKLFLLVDETIPKQAGRQIEVPSTRGLDQDLPFCRSSQSYFALRRAHREPRFQPASPTEAHQDGCALRKSRTYRNCGMHSEEACKPQPWLPNRYGS